MKVTLTTNYFDRLKECNRESVGELSFFNNDSGQSMLNIKVYPFKKGIDDDDMDISIPLDEFFLNLQTAIKHRNDLNS